MRATFQLRGKTYKPGSEVAGSGEHWIVRHVWAGFARCHPGAGGHLDFRLTVLSIGQLRHWQANPERGRRVDRKSVKFQASDKSSRVPEVKRARREPHSHKDSD